MGIFIKEEISGSVEIRRKSGRVMAILLTLGRKVIQIICAYGPQSNDQTHKIVCFYDEMVSEWDLQRSSEIIVSLGDFKGHVWKYAESLKVYMGGNGIGKNIARVL